MTLDNRDVDEMVAELPGIRLAASVVEERDRLKSERDMAVALLRRWHPYGDSVLSPLRDDTNAFLETIAR